MKLCSNFKFFFILIFVIIFANNAFSQSSMPTATTNAATSIGTTTATLNGTVNANGFSTTVTFEYGTTAAYGSTWTADQSPVTGSTDTAVTVTLGELTPNTTYHFRVVATNANGTTYGSDMTFTTVNPNPGPGVITLDATNITINSARLNSTVFTNGESTTVTFEYGETTAYGTTVNAIITPIPGTTPSFNDYVDITGLTESTTYHFRVVATNASGTVNGLDMTFTTNGLAPNATTETANPVTNNAATLKGTVNANGSSTTVYFEYGTSTSYGSSIAAVQSPLTGTTDTSVNAGISGLTTDTIYHYRVVATNTSGTTYGEDKTFYTGPVGGDFTEVETLAATNVLANSVTLNGNVNPNNPGEGSSWSLISFEIGLDTNYGGIANASPYFLTGSGNNNNFVTTDLTLLEPNTTYHYRVISVNMSSDTTVHSTTYGNDMTFTTPNGTSIPTAPTAVTNYASSITTSSATINGTVNAKNDSTTVTFEYGLDTNYGITVTASESPISGGSDTSVSYPLTTLANNTLYHYRVVATNGTGTTYGEDKTFKTGVTAPTATTNAATGVDITTATLHGTVNASNGNATVTFEYGLTNNYGRTVTASESPVTGNVNTAVSIPLTSLDPNTTYYFRVVAENESGKAYGSEMSFTTIAAPTVTTDDANPVGTTSATLNGTVNANNFSSTVTFEYGTTTAYGTTVTADQSPVTGVSNNTVSKAITGLTGATTYHYRVVGTNANGTTYGEDKTFFTSNPAAPSATTDPATSVIQTGATLHGTVNANNSNAEVTFEYGTTTAYGTVVPIDQGTISGTSDESVSATISGLSNGITYHYRVVAVNGQGTTNGADMTFTTQIYPTSETLDATNVGATSATLNGVGNGNNIYTTYTFQYGINTSYGTTVNADPNVLNDNVNTNMTADITNLSPNTTYHYRLANSFNQYGADKTFTTGSAPTATTDAATSVGTLSATLNGTVNANNLNVSVYFEFGETVSYGRQATASPNSVTGSTNTSVSAAVSLSPNTTYHFRVVADTGLEKIYGSDITLTTSGVAPTVTTESVSSLASTSATLNGTVNANNDSTTVTFEYGTTTAYGTTVTADESPVTGYSNTAVSKNITGLTNGTTYHYRVVGVNGSGTTNGSDLTFTTGSTLPSATTNAATSVTTSGATLNGTVNANGTNTTISFEYGLTTAYGNSVSASPGSLSNSTDTSVNAVISGLAINNTYHYRVVATNASGTTFGTDSTFSTASQFTISGTVTDRVNPIAGATVIFSHNGHTELTAIDGTYSYQVPFNTSTTITASKVGYTGFTPITLNNIVSDKPNQNFTSNLVNFQITATSGPGGGTNPSGTVNVGYGNDLTVVIVADAGFHIGDVIVDGVSKGPKNAYRFNNVMGNHTLHAEFIENIKPVITSFTASETVGNVQFPVEFQVDAHDPDGGEIVQYNWIIEGVRNYSTTSTSDLFNYNFLFPGLYKASVQVVDDEGEVTQSQTIEITVNLPAPITLPKSELFSFNTWIINPFAEAAEIQLKAFNYSGELLQTEIIDLEGLNKTIIDLNLFSNVDYDLVKLVSNQYVIVYSEGENETGKFVSLIKSPLKNSAIVPHIAEEIENWDTFAYVTKNKGSKLKIDVNDITTEVPSGNSLEFLNMEDYLLETTPEEASFANLSTSYIYPFGELQNLTGFEMFVKNNSDGAATELVTKPSNMLYIPHIPTETESFWTGFAFVNNNNTPASVSFTFYSKTGDYLGTVEKTIGGKSKLKGTMDSLFPEQNGLASFAIVSSNEKICGIELYGTFNAGICGFSLNSQLMTEGILPAVSSTENTWTGLAFANPNSELVNLTIKLYSKDGVIKSTTSVEINGYNQFAATLKDLFTDVEVLETDYIKFISTKPITAVEALGDTGFTYMKALPCEFINY